MSVYIIKWMGDWQGTAIERRLKDYVHGKYADEVCSSAAVKAIFSDIKKERDRLCEIAPRCKKPRVRLVEPTLIGKSYSVRLDDENGVGNRALIDFKQTNTLYIAEDELLYDAVDDTTEVEHYEEGGDYGR